MANDDTLRLPGTGYENLSKGIKGYGLAGGDGDTTDVSEAASRAGMPRSSLSRNNHFLRDIGVIRGNREIQVTPRGMELAKAVMNNPGQEQEAEAWKKVFLETRETREILEMIKVQGEVPRDQIPGRIASSLNMLMDDAAEKKIKRLVSLFQRADLLELEDGVYRLASNALDQKNRSSVRAASAPKTGSSSSKESVSSEEKIADEEVASSSSEESAPSRDGETQVSEPSLSVAVQVYVDADASAEQIDQVFASMAKHIYNREDQD